MNISPRRVAASIALVALIGVGAACTTNEDTAGTTDEDTPSTDANEVSSGLGSKDASADVKVTAFTGPDALDLWTPTVEVTNNSSGTSDYYIEANIEDADGTVTTFTNGLVQHLAAGAKATVDLVPVGATPGSTVVVTEVQRTATP
jgi:hypothetical protein